MIGHWPGPQQCIGLLERRCHFLFLNSLEDVHLTNVAIQKTAPDYDPEKGSKWSVQQLRKYLIAKHGQQAVCKYPYIIAFNYAVKYDSMLK